MALLSSVRRKLRKARQVGVRTAISNSWAQVLFRWGPRMEWAGMQILPTHYYSPVPSVKQLLSDPSILREPSDLLGIDLDLPGQLETVAKLAAFRSEVSGLDPYADFERRSTGEGYGVADAEILYAWIRANRPKRIIEVGSGVSTHYAAAALVANAAAGSPGRLTCVEPYRWQGLAELGRDGVEVQVLKQFVQDVDFAEFERLEPGDVLFIDSSHVVKVGSDVNFLFLEVLPRLRPGVVVHVHDIPLPFEFVSPEIIEQEHMFWNEVAILRALLMFNDRFAIRLASFWMAREHPDALAEAVPSLRATGTVSPSSIWIERVR